MKCKLVFGWGINDVNYNVTKNGLVNGKNTQVWRCPYYVKWRSAIQRCFDLKEHNKHPTYIGCTICEEWKYLSNFIKWVDSQPNRDWQNCQLDKDFLSGSNKHYSPDTAVFIPSKINSFIIDKGNARGDCLIGVHSYPKNKKNPYVAQCNNPLTSKRENLGYYPTELAAHKAWQVKKHEHACALADLQDDERVAEKLREMYSPDKDWTNI